MPQLLKALLHSAQDELPSDGGPTMKTFFGAASGFAALILMTVPLQAQDIALPARPAITADFPDTAAGRLVAAHMNALAGVGENAEANY